MVEKSLYTGGNMFKRQMSSDCAVLYVEGIAS